MFQIDLTLILAVFLLYTAISGIIHYRLFAKADEAGWKAFVPIYNSITLLNIVGRPLWWLVLIYFVPVINIIIIAGLRVDLLKSYGKTSSWEHVVGIIFGIVYLPYLSYQEDVKYLGKATELPKISKSTTREWIDAIGFAIFAATIIRWGLMEAFTIPTPSMEGSLLVGDFLFVSKMHYGTRSPITPVQVPFTHQKVPLIDTKSYNSLIQLPYTRFPGFTTIKRNDVVVFNVPGIAENNFEEYNRDKWIEHPIDLKTNYIKRCVALPGDIIEVRNTQIYVNDKIEQNPEKMQFSYIITSSAPIQDRVMKKYNIVDYTAMGNNENGVLTLAHMTPEASEAMLNLPFISNVEKRIHNKGSAEPNIFPNAEIFPWNGDFYGPLKVPAKGMTIPINKETLATYGKTIKLYDLNDPDIVYIEDNMLKINDKAVTEYTFNQDYYFMMGDNRHNSLDSRYWGFVPANHILGKGFFIWMSLDPNETFLNKVRWSRLFSLIK